ncbi:DNA-binding transcriptional LysR family regulator [Sphingomonas zeicaulis]|uniref:LysR substrate-binding domain-containing protein n=1 Tax=Sphingomonas zeicaulis TaxID=1632740 RepID=UPI003D191C35
MDRSRLDWDDVRLFLAIARAGTLTGAGAALKLSQPTAGRRLRALEAACGVALFQRTAGGLHLTDEGEAMLIGAQRMEEEALGLQRQFAGSGEEVAGALRLSSSEWFAHLVLTPPVTAFTARHPAVTVELIADFRLLSLDRREAELVFRFKPFDAPHIVQRRFTHIRYGLFAAPAYVEAHGFPASGADGEGHRLVMMDSQFDTLADVLWLRRRFPRAQIAIRSNSREVQAAAAACGAGLAVLPVLLGETYGLIAEADVEAPPGRDIWLGYHADLKRLRRLRALVDHLVESVDDPL